LTLERVVGITRPHRDDWWIIGSAAMILHGAASISAADVDLMTPARHANIILSSCGIAPGRDGGRDHARSVVFGQITDTALPIDVMGDLHLRSGDGWQLLLPKTRQAVHLPFGPVFIPDLPELIDITRRLGRPKDLERVLVLEAMLR
jgi:hypothetical protein